jgi:hypothetical protein
MNHFGGQESAKLLTDCQTYIKLEVMCIVRGKTIPLHAWTGP